MTFEMTSESVSTDLTLRGSIFPSAGAGTESASIYSGDQKYIMTEVG